MSDRRPVESKRLWRYAGKCDRATCDLQARYKLSDAKGRIHFLCPGHHDAALAALAFDTP